MIREIVQTVAELAAMAMFVAAVAVIAALIIQAGA